MPTFKLGGFIFRFYAADGNEPPHYHVLRDGKRAKIWLAPEIAFAYSRGYNKYEQNKVIKIARENHETLLEAWNDFFRE